jgi:hypothetical protein
MVQQVKCPERTQNLYEFVNNGSPKINKAERGQNIIFGRISISRKHRFSSKPNDFNCVRPISKGAKDTPLSQDDLRKDVGRSDAVISLTS